MSDKKDEDAGFIMDEFEWALADPTAERLREMGEVVTIITSKLVSAIDALQTEINGVKGKLSDFEMKINGLETRVARGVTASPSEAADIPTMSSAPTPTTASAPPPSAGGGGGMMGELKALLAARRKKAEPSE
ncbi:MAG: hypothetical protein RTU92_13945 [Candidatus Thorarchaeota archaeon]